MKKIDLHCDSLLRVIEGEKPIEYLLQNDEGHVDLRRLRQSDYYIQLFAAFIETPIFPLETAMRYGYQRALQMIRIFEEACEKYPELLLKIETADDMKTVKTTEKIGGILTVEEAGILDNKLELIDDLYERGVRLMTLTWNLENCLGYPNSRDHEIMEKGLKPFGIEAVEYMSEKKMIVDVSHLNDGGFWDCIRHSKEPIVASHSNCRALLDHPRNLTDEMLKAIGDKGGLVGLNFLPGFLGEGEKAGTIEAMVAHVRHMENMAGIDAIALGTDFDGFHDPCEIRDAGEMNKLEIAFEKEGFTQTEIEKILYKNAETFLMEMLPD